MTRNFLLSLFACCLFLSAGIAQTTLQGTVTDDLGPTIGSTVSLYKNGDLVTGATTNFDGFYVISNLDPGTYDVQCSYIGKATARVEGVQIKGGKVTNLDFYLEDESEVLDNIVITDYKAPLIDFESGSETTVTSENIQSLGVKTVNAVVATTGGLSTQSGSDDVSIRGSRPDATNYYVDGIRVTGLIPVSEIEQMQVLTGGLGAEYGDVTGGVISLTSKGPSSQYSGALDIETSEFLDPYGYNFANLSLSGPIIRTTNKQDTTKKTTILGFRVAAQYLYQLDDRPSAVGVYRMPAEVIQDLEEEPVYYIGGAEVPRGELLGTETLSAPMDYRPNEDRTDIDLTAKLDLRISENIDVSLSGVYGTLSDRFTPGGGWGLLNWTNNPYSTTDNYRYSLRWRHKIGKQNFDIPEDEDDERMNKTVIRNASYTLQGGIENDFNLRQDIRHEDNFFKYGQYGTRDIQSDPTVGFLLDPDNWNGPGKLCFDDFTCFDHIGFNTVEGDFFPMINTGNSEELSESPNMALARYQQQNGRLLGAEVNVWSSNLFDNVGRVYNNYRKVDRDRYTVNFTSQFDIFPSGSNKLRHNIKFGGMYESRTNRLYSINPQELWSLARNVANEHILSGVDTTSFTGDSIAFLFQGIEFQFAEYGRLINEDGAGKFYQSIREQLDLTTNDWVNIDSRQINSDNLSLDMFSARQLIDWDPLALRYYGYDFTGEEVDNVTFEDFFTETDEQGYKTHPVGPLRPTYISGYVQDKFTFKDIILRLGVRAEYFDANTTVAKDPYSLYDIMSASEFEESTGQDLPDAVGENYKVYLTGEESQEVKAFRDGDQWFNASGTATEGNLLFQDLVFPAYKNEVNDIRDDNFDPSNGFEDYTPAFNISPRVSLSFPISENAGFFAHYDQKVQRPPSNTAFTALDYYLFSNPSRLNPNGAPANNPNLRPEKTVDYEVGFQQKVTNNSAIKLSAYYRENRDMIQARYYQFVDNNSIVTGEYLTFGNIDFGTVKGFTAGYDFRRSNNLQFNVSYTLQYAEGTGSSANSGLNTRNGLVRVLIPLNFDERHRLVGNIDYRYGTGDKYNGWKIRGFEVFGNTGLNLQMAAVSGRPYTQLANPTSPFGGSGNTGEINGDRLPWNFNVDARLDRNIVLFANKEKNRKGINVNVYLRATNLLNTRNVIGVYRASGSAETDGYLDSTYGQDAVRNIQSSGKSVENYLAAYQWALLAPGFYALPRRLFFGAIIQF